MIEFICTKKKKADTWPNGQPTCKILDCDPVNIPEMSGKL
jgi:hypothetical protein